MSVIDIPLWDKAKWEAVAYAGSHDPSQPPLLALAFEDEAAAVQIFERNAGPFCPAYPPAMTRKFSRCRLAWETGRHRHDRCEKCALQRA
jgi:hypothetical protein